MNKENTKDQKHQSKTKKQSSEAWKHFSKLENGYQCNVVGCKQIYALGCATSTLLKHHKKHQSKQSQQQTLDQFIKQPELNQLIVEEMIIKWVVETIQPFSIVEDQSFKDLFQYYFKNFTIFTRKQLKSRIQEKFEEKRDKLFDFLSEFSGKVAITCDCWTSSNTESFLGTTLHLICDDWTFKSFCLDFDYLNEPHTAEYLSQKLIELIYQFQIQKKLISITSDGAPNLQNAINLIKQKLEQEEEDILFYKITCCAHRLNLIVKLGLNNQSLYFDNIISKIRKLVTKVRKSSKFTQELKENAKNTNENQKKLIMDVVTRWNSTFEMLERCQELNKSINLLIIQNKSLQNCYISQNEWDQLKFIIDFLEPFYIATLILCSSEIPSISEMDDTFSSIKDHLLDNQNISELEYASQVMLEKLDEQEQRENADLFLLAPLFNPRKKLSKLQDTSQKECIKALLIQKYQKFYFNQQLFIEKNDQKQQQKVSQMSAYKKKLFQKRKQVPEQEYLIEINKYLDSSLEPEDTNILEWWKLNQNQFIFLSKMAKDYLTSPITSVPSEQLFSISERITQNRFRLNPNTIQQLSCLKSWYKQNI